MKEAQAMHFLHGAFFVVHQDAQGKGSDTGGYKDDMVLITIC